MFYFFLCLLLLLTGCGGNDGGEKIWNGTLRRSAAEISVTDARWNGFPAWEDWRRLAASGSREIAIRGTLTLPESPAIPFQCRLSRMEDRRYSVRFSGELHEMPLWVRGELDLKRNLLAVDFQGRVSAAQYRLLHILPQLTSGMADLRGSVLFSGEADRLCMFPLLSILPVRGAGLRIGPFAFSCARAERHEEFDGRMELELRGASAHVGGMDLQFRKIGVNGRRGTFAAGIVPLALWQCTVPARGDGTFSLDAPGDWQFAAELPESCVCRRGKLILPLSSCHWSGSGSGTNGVWDWRGEGSSATLQSDAEVGTGTGIMIRGHREFRMRDHAVTAESREFSCRQAELPFAGGKLNLTDWHQEIRQTPDGLGQWCGHAGEVCWDHGGKKLLFTRPEWDVTLFAAGDVPVTPEPGKWRAAAVKWTGGPGTVSGTQWQGEVLLRERDWQCALVPQKIEVVMFGKTLTQAGGRFSLQGSRDGSGTIRFSGSGTGAELNISGGAVRCGGWSAAAELLQYGTAFREAQFRSAGWAGPGWRIAELLVRKDMLGGGRAVLKDADMALGSWRLRQVHAEIPLGRASGESGKWSAAAVHGPGREFAQFSAEVRPGADGLAFKGRATVPATGGSAFFNGLFRAGERTGSLEYSVPAASLHKELAASELVPVFKNCFFTGKIGENGKLVWEKGKFAETRDLEFSGSVRSDALLADAVTGSVALKTGAPVSARMLFGSFAAGVFGGTDGELAVRENTGTMQPAAIRFQAWGGTWKWEKARQFAVEKVQTASLLPEAEWKKTVPGTFSGTVELAPDGSVQRAVLSADGPGKLHLAPMERFRHVSGRQEPETMAFAAAAMRDFQYKTLHLRLIRRGKMRYLRVAAGGRPAAPVPFVYSGKSFRPARPGEAGFEDNVDVSCWYRLRDAKSPSSMPR